MFSQGSVATYARTGGIFSNQLTANLPRNLSVKNFVNRLRFDRVVALSSWPRFLAHSVHRQDKKTSEYARHMLLLLHSFVVMA